MTADKRKSPHVSVEPGLLEQGISQLKLEIGILDEWLQQLGSDEDEARRCYQDMLRSRHDILSALQQQRSMQHTPRPN